MKKIAKYSHCGYIDQLLEWAALVCSVCERPIQNFTGSFVNGKPFRYILEYYFPRRGPATLLVPQQLFYSVIRKPSDLLVLKESGEKIVPAGRTTCELLDIHVVISMLALLASRVLPDNDRVQVRTHQPRSTDIGGKYNSESIQNTCE